MVQIFHFLFFRVILNGAQFVFFYFLFFLMILYLLSITRKKRKESGGIFRIWLRNKGRHFWIMNEFERVGQWMNESIQGSWANMGKEETDGMDSRSWNGHSWKNGNGWNIGMNFGKSGEMDEFGGNG